MFDSILIRFPLLLALARRYDCYDKQITNMYPNWKKLSKPLEGIPIGESFGIPTGSSNHITVIDVDKASYLSIPFALRPSLTSVQTPNGATHYYFQYEPRLHTRFVLMNGVNVLNDNSFVLAGKDYHIINDGDPPKMPEVIFNQLYNAQQALIYDMHCYNVFIVLPSIWFNYDNEQFRKLMIVLINQIENPQQRVATLSQVMMDRFEYIDGRRLGMLLQDVADLTYQQRRFKLGSLKRIMKEAHPDEFKLIGNPSRAIYSPGSQMKLSEINAKIPRMTSAKLLQMNKMFTSIKVNICKSCKKQYKTGCCKKYGPNNRTTCIYICNIKLI